MTLVFLSKSLTVIVHVSLQPTVSMGRVKVEVDIVCGKKPSERNSSPGLDIPQGAEKGYRNVTGSMTRALMMKSAVIHYCKR